MKKFFKRGLLTAVSGLLLAACGSGQSANGGDAATADSGNGSTTEITFWHAMNGEQEKGLQKLTNDFNDSQDQYEVKLQGQGDYTALTQKVMASGASGSLPTMAMATPSNIPDWTGNNLLKPMDELLTEENGFDQAVKDDIFPGFLKSVNYNDKMMGLPFSKSVRVMYVNHDILDEYGVDVPQSWEDIKALGEMMQENGDDRKTLGLEERVDMEVQTMAMQNGAEWISKDLQTVDLGEDQAVEPMQFVVDGIEAGWARTAGEDGYITTPFGRGEIAVAFGSSAGSSYIQPLAEENNMNWSVEELPVYGDGNPLTLLAGNDLVVFQTASEDEQKAAVAYMNFLLQPDKTAEWAISSGYSPVTQEGIDSDAYQNFLDENPLYQAPAKEVEYADAQSLFVGSNEYRDAWKKVQDQIILEKKDVKEGLSELQEETKQIIESKN